MLPCYATWLEINSYEKSNNRKKKRKITIKWGIKSYSFWKSNKNLELDRDELKALLLNVGFIGELEKTTSGASLDPIV